METPKPAFGNISEMISVPTRFLWESSWNMQKRIHSAGNTHTNTHNYNRIWFILCCLRHNLLHVHFRMREHLSLSIYTPRTIFCDNMYVRHHPKAHILPFYVKNVAAKMCQQREHICTMSDVATYANFVWWN